MNEASVEVCHKKNMCSLLLCHSVSQSLAPDEVEVDGSGRLSRKDSASVGCLNNFLPPLCCTRRVVGYVMAKTAVWSFPHNGRGEVFKDRYVVAFVDQLTRGSRCLQDDLS